MNNPMTRWSVRTLLIFPLLGVLLFDVHARQPPAPPAKRDHKLRRQASAARFQSLGEVDFCTAKWRTSREGIDLSKGQRRKRYSLPTGRPESSATIGLQAEPETS